MTLPADHIHHEVYVLLADIMILRFHHNPDHRLCAGLSDQNSARVSQLGSNLRNRCLDVRIGLSGSLICHPNILQHLRVEGKPFTQLAQGLLSRHNHLHDLQGGQDAVTGGSVLGENNVAALLAADTAAIEALIARGGLILGICNGFQALVKSGLLPYGHLGTVTKDSPTLFRNDINRHISQIAFTRVASVNSPWLAGMNIGDTYAIPVSHGEGKFVVNEELAKELFANGQVAFQYAEPVDEGVSMHSPYNPNGSYYAIEGIISKNGQILGKMGHSERYENNLFKNIAANLEQPLFENAVKYFRGE